MSKFLRDSERAKEVEKYVAQEIEKLGETTLSGDGKLVDLFINRIDLPQIKCEIKHDIMSDRTGNIAIEFFNSKTQKPSGISSTTCDLWFHVLGQSKEIWFTSTSRLKEFCKTKPLKIITAGGDDNSDMLIYKKDLMPTIFIKLSDVRDFKKVVGDLLC